MSRFFASGSSSSSEENEALSSGQEDFVEVKESRRAVGLFEALSLSEDESDQNLSSYGESDEEASAGEEQPVAPVRKSRFLFDSDSESSEEESTQRQIKSQREKIQEEMENLADALETGIESQDWCTMQEDYDRMFKLITKYQATRYVPVAAYCVLPALETSLNKYAAGTELKTLNAVPAKAFNALRQKIRKALTSYASEIEHAQRIRDGEEEESVADSTSVGGPVIDAAGPRTTELTPETVLKRLAEIISTRGRKHVDRAENISLMRRMMGISSSRRNTAHVLVALITTQLEASGASHLGYLSIEAWLVILGDLAALIDLLEKEDFSPTSEGTIISKEEEDLGLPSLVGLRGSMISYCQRLDDEFTKALQNIDPHSNEYLDYLRTEPKLYVLLDRCRQIILATLSKAPNNNELACQIGARQLEHVYCKPREIAKAAFGNAAVLPLCGFIYQNGSERQKVRALLCHVYWLAIHGAYEKARDLMLQSHIQDALHVLDISTQVLYNRALVQVGLAAFRQGYLKETYFALQELCSTGRPKELLAQGLVGQKYTEKGEMDRAERQRLVPYHMQINVEMIDCVFLTVAMLLELPQNAAASKRYFSGERRLFQSRHLRRILDAHDRNLFNGPPDNTREFIVAAAKALANGNWRICEQHMMQIKIWDLLPAANNIRSMLRVKIREAALLSFLYSSAPTYGHLAVSFLATDFDLEPAIVVKVISSLITDYGLPALLSNEQDFVSMREDCEPSAIRELILQLNDKIASLAERNAESSDLIASLNQLHNRNAKLVESLSGVGASANGSVRSS